MFTGSKCIVFVAALALCGCNVELGNGQLGTQSRAIDTAFTRVSVNSGFQAELGLGPRALTLTTDENLLALVETFVDGETLVVRVRPDAAVSTRLGLKVLVVTEALRGLEASGGSQVNAVATPTDNWQLTVSGGSAVSVHSLDAQRFTADASGGSRVTASGAASVVQASGSGGSHFDVDGVPADDVALDGSGGSVFLAHAARSATGVLSGGSRATISGSPATRQFTLSGGSEVVWVE